jgi:hypothetical protein
MLFHGFIVVGTIKKFVMVKLGWFNFGLIQTGTTQIHPSPPRLGAQRAIKESQGWTTLSLARDVGEG